MTSEAKAKNISFQSTLGQYLTESEQNSFTKQKKCETVIKIFTYLNKNQKIWINNPKYSRFKTTVINKAYYLLDEIQYLYLDPSLAKPETLEEVEYKIDTVLRLVCCNKTVKGRYCKRKKIGEYCTFHANIKNQITTCLIKSTESHIIKDITNIIGEYISL